MLYRLKQHDSRPFRRYHAFGAPVEDMKLRLRTQDAALPEQSVGLIGYEQTDPSDKRTFDLAGEQRLYSNIQAD
ncbi:hypothetical protein D3C75_1339960 [compost metagenome]